PAQVLPALAEEPQHLVRAAGLGQSQADGAVEGVLADPDVVAVAAALGGDWPDEIDLVQFVGGPGLPARPPLGGGGGGGAGRRRGGAAGGRGGPAAQSSRCVGARARWCAGWAAGGCRGP